MYIIISFISYKFIFIKQYNKYLETYLHIIAIDFELNKIKKDNQDQDKLDNIDIIMIYYYTIRLIIMKK